MSRLLAALAALLLAAPALAAQEEKKPADQPAATKPADQTAPELDPKTKAAIEREIERAKEDIRNEVRAEIQGAQSAAEFLGTVAEGPKLQFFQLDGYFRFRYQWMLGLDITGVPDASGYYLFPVSLHSKHETLNSANMRLRLEPTLNVSEHVRVRAQVDVLDNYVLGSSNSTLSNDPGSPYPVPFSSSNPVLLSNDPRADRPAITPKRVWAEVQTPVGLLSFGRMPSEWGLGILTHAGSGLDDDLGDTRDRIQFALPPVPTPLGRLAFVPILDFDSAGVLYGDTRFGAGTGQSFTAEPGAAGRTYGLKIARLDTDDEIRRKHERNESSFNFGLYYNYRQQKWFYPQWDTNGFGGTYTPGEPGGGTGTPPASQPYGDTTTAVHRSAYANVASLWLRYLGPRLRVETEIAGVYGHVGNPSADPTIVNDSILLRQLGGTIVSDYKVIPNKLTLGGELGIASGDSAPGFGNVPGRTVATNPGFATPYGSVEGAQWRQGVDNTIRNFQFNPAYRVDLVLFRNILGAVTDAMYVKPTLRWEMLPGLRLDEAIIYSRAMYAQSTPSAKSDPFNPYKYLAGSGDANLGIELDTTLTYGSGDGFHGWFSWGFLQPLGGLSYNDAKMSRAHFLEIGLAAKF
jgi:uncharacterized protein (TIGR04551 family)